MLISHSHRFIFIHIAKTAGISIRDVLSPLCEEPERFKIRRPPRMSGGKPNPLHVVWETLLLHARARDVRKEVPAEAFDAAYKFAFVRNPWDWHVSMYHFILREPTMPAHLPVKALGTFESYLEWVIATADPHPKHVPKLQLEMLTDDAGKLLVDFIGRYETLAQDFAHACRKIGIDGTLPHLNRSEHRDYRGYYDERTKQLVAEHFRPDIESFGYTFDGHAGGAVKV